MKHNISPLEAYISSYTRQHKRHKEQATALKLAIGRIAHAIDRQLPCPEACREYPLSYTVLLLIPESRHFKKSMLRAKKLLEAYDKGCCN